MWPQTFFLSKVKFIIKFQTLQLDLMCIFLAGRLMELLIEVLLNVSINLAGDLSLIES